MDDKNGIVADFQVILIILYSRTWGTKTSTNLLTLLSCCITGHHRYRQCRRSVDALVEFQLGFAGNYMSFPPTCICIGLAKSIIYICYFLGRRSTCHSTTHSTLAFRRTQYSTERTNCNDCGRFQWYDCINIK